jgi:hypothetical protein
MNFEGQTLFSPLTIKVLLVPIGNIPAAVFSQYAAEIRRHASMDLQSLATYDDLSCMLFVCFLHQIYVCYIVS